MRSSLIDGAEQVSPASLGTARVEIENVSKTFVSSATGDPTSQPCDDVSLSIGSGSFTSIVGPSGCGKSTLLNIVAGLLPPDEGRVILSGKDIKGPAAGIGYVTQDANLLPWKTVYQNVELPLRISGVAKKDRPARVESWLERVGLSDSGALYPSQLSGGMQKRASIARALVYAPSLVLMDEPFGPLDAITRLVLQQTLLDIWESEPRSDDDSNTTMIFVTHDLVEAVALSDRVVVMDRNPGRLKTIIDVNLPRPRRVAEASDTPGFAEIHRELWTSVKETLPTSL